MEVRSGAVEQREAISIRTPVRMAAKQRRAIADKCAGTKYHSILLLAPVAALST